MATNFSFNYLPQPYKDPKGNIYDIYRPLIPARLSYNHKIGQPFYALVDSGSDKNLFPAALAIMLGVNIKKGASKNITGIGNATLIAYTHSITLYIGTKSFKTEIDFSYDQQTPLLGRNGFFSLFREIKFSEKVKLVEFII